MAVPREGPLGESQRSVTDPDLKCEPVTVTCEPGRPDPGAAVSAGLVTWKTAAGGPAPLLTVPTSAPFVSWGTGIRRCAPEPAETVNWVEKAFSPLLPVVIGTSSLSNGPVFFVSR